MIIYCCNDLIFATKIRSTVQYLKVASRPARSAEALQKRLDQIEDGKCNEPVTGVLVDLDLGEVALGFIEQAKQHRVCPPVVAFGSHVAAAMLDQAQKRGADFVLPRSTFTSSLPDLITRFDGGSLGCSN